ncbi:hypothetical protein GCM10027174_38950 [Salinifilum aidingensis]
MRSRIAHRSIRLSVVSAGAASVPVVTATTAAAAPVHAALAQQPSPLESLSTPVGLGAVGLGVAGMVAGAFRKKKVHPENQRKH